ncbi:dienelactone hydrolase [Cellulomonas sp. H30R-01]|uniref:dienelactone hydrolase family protein n=1 Tax=Cellulomonas sp. H30R-01 TaxID=2704467 RepID=UPI00138CADDC|nr:dienelactone hydrolase family protein [Cellulomonas sp. H30R-01]QHT57603.1 dienelactone hydrolase [Cellulomonas sp. H30R-01]
MAEVVLFHHAQGLTPGVQTLAETLRAAGHTVHVPDLYDGRTFDDLESGIGYAEQTGFQTVVDRGVAAVRGLPDRLVVVGISLGVMSAQTVAQQRPGVVGAVLVGSCVPPEALGSAWPDHVPVQVHGMDADPVFVGEGDVEAARELVDAVPDGELFLYPGDQHLFVDASLPAYDEDAAALLRERVLAFLDRVG